jgi:hypothetical protein
MLIRAICNSDTPFSRILKAKTAEVMWHVKPDVPLSEVTQLASFLEALGLDTKNAGRLGIGKTFFLVSEDGKTLYDTDKSPNTLGLKNGCTARIVLNYDHAQLACSALPDAKTGEPQVGSAAPDAPPSLKRQRESFRAAARASSRSPLRDTAKSSPASPSAETTATPLGGRKEVTRRALRKEASDAESGVQQTTQERNSSVSFALDTTDHPSASPVHASDPGASSITEGVANSSSDADTSEKKPRGSRAIAIGEAIFNVDEFLGTLANNRSEHNLSEMMEQLTDQLSTQLQKEYKKEEDALRHTVAVGKLDKLVMHICRRQVLKAQQIQQLLYEKQMLVKMMEQRRSLAGSAAKGFSSRHQFQATSLGEPLSRSYYPSVLELL